MHSMTRRAALAALLLVSALSEYAHAATAPEPKTYKVAWSIYVGWMPWDYADRSGHPQEVGRQVGIRIQLTQVNDYVESINQYTAGKFDACVMTNMDMLTIPAAGGVDSTALIVGDYSNGNDGVVLKGKGKTLADIKGQSVNLVELSVSHYLLARGLTSIGLKERDIKVVNTWTRTSSAPSRQRRSVGGHLEAAAVGSAEDAQHLAGVRLKQDSRRDPRSDGGQHKDAAGQSGTGQGVVGAWYETLALMAARTRSRPRALEAMAKASGTDLAGFREQLPRPIFTAPPPPRVAFTTSADLPAKMDWCASFPSTMAARQGREER